MHRPLALSLHTLLRSNSDPEHPGGCDTIRNVTIALTTRGLLRGLGVALNRSSGAGGTGALAGALHAAKSYYTY